MVGAERDLAAGVATGKRGIVGVEVVRAEGDLLKKRYRVVKIGVSSVVMEDLQYKSEQTLPLEPLVV